MDGLPELSKRLNYQRLLAEGKIVNIGCGENPAKFPDETTTHVDMDVYNHKNFVQADAHNLPFPDQTFDTAVLGDMLEHCPDPVQVLREAGRVAKKVVATIFEEWRIDEINASHGNPIAKMHDDEAKMGFRNHLDYLKSLPTVQDKIVSVTDDSEVSHHPHIQAFSNGDIHRMCDEAGLEIQIYNKFVEGQHEGRDFYNWVIVARRKP